MDEFLSGRGIAAKNIKRMLAPYLVAFVAILNGLLSGFATVESAAGILRDCVWLITKRP